MSVIPQSFNQGTGFVGSVSTGGTIPSEIDDLIVTNSLTSLGTTTLEGPTVINSTLDVSGDVTVNNATVNGFLTAPNLAITAVNKNDNTPFPVLFYDATTKKVCIGDPATFTYNPFAQRLTVGLTTISALSVDSGLLQGQFVLGGTVTATQEVSTPTIGATVAVEFNLPTALPTTVGQVLGITNLTGANGHPNTSWQTATAGALIAAPKGNNFEYVVPFIDPVSGDVNKDSQQSHFTYNPGRNGRLTTEKLAITTLPQDNTDNNNRYILFQGVDNEIHGDSNLLFNPSTGILTAPNLAITAVNNNDNTPFPVLFYDATTKQVCIGDPATLSSFTYNPNTRKLILENAQITNADIPFAQISILTALDAYITAATKSDNTEYTVVLQNPANNEIVRDAVQTNLTYNPGRGRLTTEKLAITTLPQDNTDNNNRYILFKGVDNEIHGDSKLLFNPSTNLLAITDMNCQDITSTGSVSTAELSVGPPPSGTREIRVLGATGNGGTIFNDTSANPSAYFGLRSDTGSTFGIAYNIGMWNDGHMRYQATTNGHRFYVRNNNVTEQIVHITPTSILMTKNLFLEGEARLRLDKDIRFQETDSTTAGTKGIINWEQIGSIIAYRNNSTTASLSMVNKYAQDLGTNMQIQLQNNATLINTPDTGATGKISLQVAGNERVAVTDDVTTFSHAVDPNVLKTPDNNYMKLPTGTPSLGDAIRFSGTGAGTISNPWLTEWG